MKLPRLPDTQSRRRLIAIGTALFVVSWIGLATRGVLGGRASALAGLDQLEAIRYGFEFEQLESGELTAGLVAASDEFANAQSKLRDPWVAPFRILPWVGTQIRSADALSTSARTATNSLAEATASVLTIKKDTQAAVINRADASQQLLELTTKTRAQFAGLDLGPAGGLAGQLSNARSRFERELDDLDSILADAETALAGVTDFLRGPTEYLLLSANTSEMRVGSGRFLIAGPIAMEDGVAKVGRLVPPEELLLPDAILPEALGDFATSWSQLEPTGDLRNLATTARFDATASMAADIWENATGQRVDGVIAIDAVALQSVLGTGDGISVDGLAIDASNVISHIVLEQYWEDDKPTRRARQRELASVAVSAAIGPGVDLIDLARTLDSAVAGRHILAWSDSAVQQAAWESIGADGRLESDSLMISLLNDGFNKLDTFVGLDAVASTSQVPGGTAFEITIDVRNSAGPQLPDYVLGPYDWAGLELGSYRGILVVNLPGGATDVSGEGPGDQVGSGRDGPTQLLAFRTRVDSAQVVRYTIRFTLPEGLERFTVEPSARIPAVQWTVDGQQWRDVAARTIDVGTGSYGSQPDQDSPDIDFATNETSVPPSPLVQLTDTGDAVAISWRVPPEAAEIVVWERSAPGAWQVLESSRTAVGQLKLPINSNAGLRCFRISLSEAATTFSSTSCLDTTGT